MQPRIDLQVPYKAFPRRPSAAFRALDGTPVWMPVLDITVASGKNRIRTFALLDTGAGVTVFGTQHADALGIDWKNGPDIDILGLGGECKGYAADVKLVIPAVAYAWPARIVFSPGIDSGPYPILGHHGFFEHFEVRFSSAAKQFRIHLK